MRIAVLFDNLGPYHIARLSSAAERAGVVGIEFGNRSADYPWDPAIEALTFERCTVFPEGTSRGRSSGEFRERMDEALKMARPDVVAVPGWSGRGAFTALRWCGTRGVPAVLMSESNAWDEPRHWMKETVKRLYLRAFAAALVGGRSHAAYLEQLGMPAERISLGYDAVDNGYFAREADAARSAEAVLRGRLGLPNRFFLASSRFIGKKNLSGLLSAYARYLAGESGSKDSKPWDLVILGDGPLRQELETLRHTLGLQERVVLPGFRQYADLPAYYGLAGAFVHASTSEQWGLVVNEAMASRLPVLVSERCGCAADLIQDGINGWTFDPADAPKLAELLTQVSSMPSERRREMGEASRQVISDWGPERFAEGLCRAAECAAREEPRRPAVLDRLVLEALVRR